MKKLNKISRVCTAPASSITCDLFKVMRKYKIKYESNVLIIC